MSRILKWDYILVRSLSVLAIILASVMFANGASAQTTTRYTNSTDSATNGINENATPCTNRFTRTFNVTGAGVVGDVNIGVLMAHTYRGDILMYLVAPDGTRIQIATGTGAGADNFNVLFDDSAPSSITTHTANDTATATTVVPAYQRTFSPTSALSGFNGKTAAGTWTLEICDRFGGDSGTFYQADLYIQAITTADLSLSKTVSNPAPVVGNAIVYTVSVTNSGTSSVSAGSVVVRDLLPAGVSYTGHSAPAGTTYTPGTGLWSVGTLGIGVTRTLTINATVTATSGAFVQNIAEVTASSVTDPDSTPNNGLASEDDYATASFTVGGARVAGVPPTLTCPRGNVLFDWGNVAWTAGATSNSYPLSTLGNIDFTITNPGTYFSSATYGGQSPTRQNVINGGFGTGEFSLSQIVDLPTTNDVVTTVIDLPTVMSGAQFRIFDIDYFAGQFADRIEVIGYNGATVVMPTLTNGISNYVIGNQAFGDGLSADAEPNGNLVITFTSPIDRIEILYGNHTLGSPTPGLQGIAIHDINFCIPPTTLSVTKVSSIISDKINGTTNPKALPEALAEYNFTVQNPNDISVQNVIVTDFFPADLKMCFASLGGQGPVAHTGFPASGLTYSFTDLNNDTDTVDFTRSNPTDAVINWNDDPVLDGENCDSTIKGFRVRPTGLLNPGAAFTLRARFRIK